MVIGEAASPDQIDGLRSIFKEELKEIVETDGNLGANFMVEEGGNLIIALTHWKTREDCVRYHSSRAYRQFVAKSHPLLIGDFVVKLFRME
jgi:quinol monooxygenase YgiN